MELIEFPEQTRVIAADQPQYRKVTAWIDSEQNRVVCLWQLNWRERLTVLFTGRIWQQLLQVEYPFRK